MPKPANPRTPEARLIAAALRESGVTQAELAAHLELSPGAISQFATGSRPVPLTKARPLATQLGVSPGEISASYREALEVLSDLLAPSQSVSITPEIVQSAIQASKTTLGIPAREPLDVEAEMEVFVRFLRIAIERSSQLKGSSSEHPEGNGTDSGNHSPANEPQARPIGPASGGRRRKSA